MAALLTRRSAAIGLALPAMFVAGCGAASSGGEGGIPARLVAQSRPIGAQARFYPPAPSRRVPNCTRRLGARTAVHVELFAEDRVVVLPAGIGTEGPRRSFAGRIVSARCYGDVVTIEPTGIVLVRRGRQARLADLFRLWGRRIAANRLGGFAAPGGVRVYLAGRRLRAQPGSVALSRHAEIVLEAGPFVPPHSSFTFPRGY
jgi:hypothetical protein